MKNVVLMGINTNTCVLNTAFTAFNFDYRVVVLSDCVASMYGDDLHVLGLQNVARCLGWVITNEQFFEKLEGGASMSVHRRRFIQAAGAAAGRRRIAGVRAGRADPPGPR